MIWHYFPIGMRFPVPDFSNETKRGCWQIALSAVFASDARGTTLYEACESFDSGSESAVYTCIVCYEPIKQSRAAGKMMHALDGLMTRLCLHDPLVQANYLERFGPYPPIGAIDPEGAVVPNEAGEAFLPTGKIVPAKRCEGWSLLFACDGETESRMFGIAAAENGFRVRRLLLADGKGGAVHALVSGMNGRYETVTRVGSEGDHHTRTVGVIPGKTAVLETGRTAGCGAALDANELVSGVLDLGYRNLLIADGGTDRVRFGKDDPRIRQCEITVLSDNPNGDASCVPAADWILDRVDFASKARAADFVIVCTDRSEIADTVLSRLTDLGRACCLVSDSYPDPDAAKRIYPTLRGIVRFPADSAPASDLFRSEIRPLIGKSVAKTADP
jgi:hypothetical protein